MSPCMMGRMEPPQPIVMVGSVLPFATGQLALPSLYPFLTGQKELLQHSTSVLAGPVSVFCAWRNFFCPSAVVVSFWLRGAGVFLIAVFVVLTVFGAVAGAVAGGGFGFLIVFGCFVASGCV